MEKERVSKREDGFFAVCGACFRGHLRRCRGLRKRACRGAVIDLLWRCIEHLEGIFPWGRLHCMSKIGSVIDLAKLESFGTFEIEGEIGVC